MSFFTSDWKQKLTIKCSTVILEFGLQFIQFYSNTILLYSILSGRCDACVAEKTFVLYIEIGSELRKQQPDLTGAQRSPYSCTLFQPSPLNIG